MSAPRPDPLKEQERDLYTAMVQRGASPELAAFVEEIVEESFARRRAALDVRRHAETMFLCATALAAVALVLFLVNLFTDLRL